MDNDFDTLPDEILTCLGLPIIELNPFFSSIIGKYKFSHIYGISIHASAALVLA